MENSLNQAFKVMLAQKSWIMEQNKFYPVCNKKKYQTVLT